MINFAACYHLRDILTPKSAKILIRNSVRKIEEIHSILGFETLVFTGYSGALIAPILSYRTGIPLTLIRKEKPCEGNHSEYQIEGFRPKHKYLFVDDLVFSGATFSRIITKMKEVSPNAECVGGLMYQQYKGGSYRNIPLYGIMPKPKHKTL